MHDRPGKRGITTGTLICPLCNADSMPSWSDRKEKAPAVYACVYAVQIPRGVRRHPQTPFIAETGQILFDLDETLRGTS